MEPINDLPEENGGVSINQSHVIDENKPPDISMHNVTVSEKGWWFVHSSILPHLLLSLFIFWPFFD